MGGPASLFPDLLSELRDLLWKAPMCICSHCEDPFAEARVVNAFCAFPGRGTRQNSGLDSGNVPGMIGAYATLRFAPQDAVALRVTGPSFIVPDAPWIAPGHSSWARGRGGR